MQPIIGLIMFLFLMLPPVANLLESIMIFHMHMQMPLIAISGFLMAPFFMEKFPKFFAKWNERRHPGNHPIYTRHDLLVDPASNG